MHSLALIIPLFLSVANTALYAANSLEELESSCSLIEFLDELNQQEFALSTVKKYNQIESKQYNFSSLTNEIQRLQLAQLVQNQVTSSTLNRLARIFSPSSSSGRIFSVNTSSIDTSLVHRIVSLTPPESSFSYSSSFIMTPIFDFIGAGRFGTVFRATELETGDQFALKRTNVNPRSQNYHSFGSLEETCTKAAGLLAGPSFKERAVGSLQSSNSVASWMILVIH